MKLNFKPIVITVLSLMALLMTASVALARDYVVPDEPLNMFYDGRHRIGMTYLSTDGRFVVTVDSREVEHYVYLHDRLTDTTELVSVNSQGIGLSSDEHTSYGVVAAVSDDGRYVVFDREYEDQQYRTYIRDRTLGQTHELPSDGIGQQDLTSDYRSPRITPDGRYVVFYGGGQTSPDGVTDNCTLDQGWSVYCPGVFVHDTTNGTTERISVNTARQPANSGAGYGDISDNGRFVLFISDATNLGGPNEICGEEGTEQGLYPCGYLYLHDRATHETSYLPLPYGSSAFVYTVLIGANISGNGRYIVYSAHIEDEEEGIRTFLYDRLTEATKVIFKQDNQGTPASTFLSGLRAISDDGRYTLVKVNGEIPMYVYDSVTEALAVVVDSMGQPYMPDYDFLYPLPMSISGDGELVALSKQFIGGEEYTVASFLADGQTFSPAPYTEVELVQNGGAEAQGIMTKMPQNWDITDYRAGRRRCDYFPNTDSCVFQIKPVKDKIARLTQSVPAVNNPGDTLNFSASVRGFNVSRATVRVLINYADGTTEFVKIPSATLNGTYNYKQVTANLTLDKLAYSIKVQMYIHNRGTGKLLVDDVSLKLGSGEAEALGLIPVPDAPILDTLPGRTTN